MTGAGELDQRVTFQKQGAAGDGAGGTTSAFADQFTVWAKYTHLRGGEEVMAARLGGRHTQVVRVRRSTQTLLADTSWRLVDARTGTEFNIRDITPSEDRSWLDFLCESGVAT